MQAAHTLIQNILYLRCNHQTKHHRDKINCDLVITNLNSLLISNSVIPDILLNNVIIYLTQVDRYRQYDNIQNTCLFHNKQAILDILIRIVQKQNLTSKIVTSFTKSNLLFACYKYLEKYYNINFYTEIVENQFRFCDIDALTDLDFDYSVVDFVLNNINIKDNLLLLTKTRVEKISQRIAHYLEKEEDTELNLLTLINLLKSSIEYLPYTRCILTSLYKINNHIFDNNILEKVCKTCNIQDLEFYFNLVKENLVLTSNCFENILLSDRYLNILEYNKLCKTLTRRKLEDNSRL
jgi:hypothetical protein